MVQEKISGEEVVLRRRQGWQGCRYVCACGCSGPNGADPDIRGRLDLAVWVGDWLVYT